MFHTEVFKQGITFEWVKHKVAIKLECKYQDLLLFHDGKRVIEPFSIVDMPAVKSGAHLEVQIAEGAEVGLDRLRKEVAQDIENDAKADANNEEEKE